LEQNPAAYAAWRSAIDAARNAYRTIQSQLATEPTDGGNRKERVRAVRSAARSVLPNATATKIVVTANARSLRHFLMLRGAIEGDVEMRQVSGLIYAFLAHEAPSLVRDFQNSAREDQIPYIIRHVVET
jgi:thymidylate synthase (FAD)